MRISLFIIASVLTIGFFTAASTYSDSAKKTYNKWFEFTGTAVRTDYENPSRYVLISSEPPTTPGKNKLHAIHVDNATEVYTSGALAGQPKVNTGALNADILDATGISDGVPNEIPDRVLLKD